MSYIEDSAYCMACEANVLIRALRPNHVLHLLLSTVTMGLWMIVWGVLSVRKKNWRCSRCGRLIDFKVCHFCESKNNPGSTTCYNCGRDLG